MNDLLKLKGKFGQKRNESKPGPPELPAAKHVDSQHVQDLATSLRNIRTYWDAHNILKLDKLLVSVYYIDVIAKSNRVSRLLSERGKKANDSVVGAKFASTSTFNDTTKRKHVITHYADTAAIEKTIANLEECARILEITFGGIITSENLARINTKETMLPPTSLSKSAFAAIVKDAYYVEQFGIELETSNMEDQAIVSIYETEVSASEVLRKLGIDSIGTRLLDETTLRLSGGQYLALREKVPYLISMAVENLADLSSPEGEELESTEPIRIKAPGNEPVIGVIDTLFDKRVYFHEWVDYHNNLPEGIEGRDEDYLHGTGVSSIIVDGPKFNPRLEDGCGNFRVRHFGVATSGKFSSFYVMERIEQIVVNNPDIKVWNLSLGSNLEISPNFASPEAAILDRLQYEHDVLFVVAGTNDNRADERLRKIGAPADSINSLVVNSVGFEGKPASYTRTGPVLSFFGKPDISYYGGDTNQKIRVCSATGERMVQGTSYAAPWIARKMAYLIQIMGLSREVAKALIIDSAIGWNRKDASFDSLGYGIVPVRIEDVVKSQDDEIKFVFSDVSEQFDTYAYNIPLPVVKEKQPYLARATLCYFPKCMRRQGVDYTSTELDLHFGRLNNRGIKSLDNNTQCDEGTHYLREGNARHLHRKWDNVKHIGDLMKSRQTPRKIYSPDGLWGISLKTKERLNNRDGKDLPFGVVVTLKEMNGVNRIQDFVRLCQLKQWIVNTVNVENHLDIYQAAEEEIKFDD
ncbi:MAG: S8 family peptidase [Bacteroides sp.]